MRDFRLAVLVLQQISIYNDLTVWENMELHGRLDRISNPQRQKRINQWLYVELAGKRDNLLKILSGSTKRRLQIARA